jgi:hypothetical protein
MIAVEVINLSTVEVPQPTDDSVKGRTKARLRAFRQARLDPEKEKRRDEAVVRLGRESRIFAQVMRQRLGTPDVEALFRAFPVPGREPSGERPASQSEDLDASTT